ncbi:tRNA(m(1)G37)methyltransferase [Vanrija albida]|uniref:tRNA (guanine(37)-N1)-methyltransferase n=1 Tax=Vanrija albida TaxID=181172 RepID=A0ABR3PRH2_9TREE
MKAAHIAARIASLLPRTMSTSSPSPSLRALQPPQHKGMTALDRSKFALTIPVLAARVRAGDMGAVRKHDLLRGHIVDIPKIRSITPDADPALRRLLLRVADPAELPEPTRAFLADSGIALEPDSVTLGYEHWTASEILNAVIETKEDEDTPSSFTQTGHIAHVNLREEWLPYKAMIGQVILDKIPSIRTVVNKLSEIHAEYRYFDMEVIAGDEDFVATTSESGCTFTFDFAHVYWNSRLHTEHERLISQFAPGSVVADAMAGVGPFAVPAAKRGAYVLGNDLNPESVRWMRENRVRNKVEERLRVTEADARAFIRGAPAEAWRNPFPRSEPLTTRQREREARRRREAAKEAGVVLPREEKAEEETPKPQTVDHYVMNLPDSALEFLDAYAGSFTPLLDEPGFDAAATTLPLIHCHCFTRFLDLDAATRDINERATAALGHPVTTDMDGYLLHLVRRVAPNKDMYCLTFRLPHDVAYKKIV